MGGAKSLIGFPRVAHSSPAEKSAATVVIPFAVPGWETGGRDSGATLMGARVDGEFWTPPWGARGGGVRAGGGSGTAS